MPKNTPKPSSLATATTSDRVSETKKLLRSWLPTDNKSALFTLVSLVYLVAALLQYARTGDSTMLTSLLAAIGGYAGIDTIGKIKGKQDNDSSK